MKRWLLLTGLLLAGVLPLAQAQTGIGAPFGARDPRTCTSAQLQGGAAPSVELAIRSFICRNERIVDARLWLVENVKLQIAPKGRPFNPLADSERDDIDPAALVYRIRGSYNGYRCARLTSSFARPEGNCVFSTYPNAEGACYKNTFGEWRCSMADFKTPKPDLDRKVPAPR